MPKNYPFQERRDSVRVGRIITVRHRLFRRRKGKADPAWQLAVSENISLCGLLFVSALAYQAGDIIELGVAMPGLLDIFKGYGKVVRIRRNKSGYYQVAVKYVDLKSKRASGKTV